jgi:hypothetical protein
MFRLLQGGVGLALLALIGCAQPRSLLRDAEVAEDNAIRYADSVRGPHYAQLRDQRMAEMFKMVAARDGVTEEQVRESLTHRPAGVDLAAMLSFAAFYVCIAELVLRRVSSVAMIIYNSVVLSIGGVLLGEGWAILIEQLRLGTGHLSYRMYRIPWSHHRVALLIAGAVLYWVVTIVRNLRKPVLA